MKIALFCNTISFRRGGERLLLDVLNNLPKDLDITIFTRDYGKSKAFPGFEKFKIRKFSGILDLLKIEKFDVLFSWLSFPNYSFAGIVKRFNKNNKSSKLIWYSGGAYLPNREEPKLRDFPKKLFSDWGVKQVDKIIVLSDYLGEEIKKYNNRDSLTIHCGLEINDFKKEKTTENKIPIILFPTFISRVKGVYEVYEVAKELLNKGKKFKLIITGGGPDKEELEELSKKDNVSESIIIKDNLEDKEFKELYNNCDFVLYPPFKEPFGLVPLEAMLYEKGVIYRDEGGPHEILKNTKNLPFKTQDELKNQIEKLLTDKKLRNEIAKGAKEFVIKNFDIKITANKLTKEIRKL